MSRLVLIGADFRSASASVRARLVPRPEEASRLLGWLRGEEGLILATCNRVEFLLWQSGPADAVEVLSEHAGVPYEALDGRLYELAGDAAREHVFRVAAGLESAILGETEIASQLKSAVLQARRQGWLGPVVEFVVRDALACGARIRRETNLSRGVTSFSSLALREASRLVHGLDGRSVVVVGAGQVAERLLKDLSRIPLKRLAVLNRTLGRAQELATTYRSEAHALSEVAQAVEWADLLFTAVPGELGCLAAPEALDRVRSRATPLTVLDLGAPSSLPHRFAGLANVQAIGMGALIAACERNAQIRRDAVAHAETIIHEALAGQRVGRS